MTAALPSRVLVVDDDPVARLVLARILDRLGHETSTASTVAGGIDLALRFRPDVVFVDYELPDGTADDLLVAVRLCSLSTPVVLVTGVAGLEQSRARFGAGLVPDLPTPSAVLLKPVDSRAVSECLRGLAAPAAAA